MINNQFNILYKQQYLNSNLKYKKYTLNQFHQYILNKVQHIINIIINILYIHTYNYNQELGIFFPEQNHMYNIYLQNNNLHMGRCMLYINYHLNTNYHYTFNKLMDLLNIFYNLHHNLNIKFQLNMLNVYMKYNYQYFRQYTIYKELCKQYIYYHNLKIHLYTHKKEQHIYYQHHIHKSNNIYHLHMLHKDKYTIYIHHYQNNILFSIINFFLIRNLFLKVQYILNNLDDILYKYDHQYQYNNSHYN